MGKKKREKLNKINRTVLNRRCDRKEARWISIAAQQKVIQPALELPPSPMNTFVSTPTLSSPGLH